MVQADPGDDWRNETRQHGSLCEGEGRGTTRKVTHGVSLQTALNLDPFMIHETFLCLTETAFGSHPCRVVSVTYRKLWPFHGGNTGSNPVGDANLINHLQVPSRILYVR